MSRMTLLTVGSPSDAHVRAALTNYLERMRPPFWELEWQTVKAVPYQRGEEARAKLKEGERLLARIGPPARMVLLDVAGTQWDTDEFLTSIRQWRDSGKPLIFVIGGSLGVDDRVRARADERWSLSRLTFPHGLAQLLVAEQLYRVATMDQGHPYHKV